MDLKIVNGTLVTATRTARADIGIARGKIVAIGRRLKKPANRTIDATGKLVLPGAIDAHVHFCSPASGTITIDDFRTGTIAAACGGVTTIIDFAIQAKGQSLIEAVHARRALADDRVVVDYALHATPTNWSQRTKNEISQLVEQGIRSFKVYMAYKKEGLYCNDAVLFEVLEQAARLGAMVSVHAESADLLDLFIARYHQPELMKRYGAYAHALSRPNFIEAEAIQRAIIMAQATGALLYIVHMSTAEGVDLVAAAQKRGARVYAETCPHYLLFDDSIFKRPDGYLYATSPQVKKKKDRLALWQGLVKEIISVVATDHCAFSRRQKGRWKGDFTRIPNGLPGVETMLPLLYTHGIRRKKITLQQLVGALSTNPAKLMGLYPKKGTIRIGADADLVIFDPKRQVTIGHKRLATPCDWSPYEGMKIIGWPMITICRGAVVVENGGFVGTPGWGKFIARHKRLAL